jgi:cell division protein FtsB
MKRGRFCNREILDIVINTQTKDILRQGVMTMNKGKKKKSSFGVILLLAVFLYLSYIAVGQQKLINSKNDELNRINNKIAEEEKINEQLTKEMEMIDSDEYKEKVAREKFGMVKENETVYVDIGNK